jgi:hypothetical protein
MKTIFKEFSIKKKNKLLIVSELLNKPIEQLWNNYGGPLNYFRIAQFENDGIEEFSELPYGELFYSTKNIYIYESANETVLIELSDDLSIGNVYNIDNFYFDIMLKYLNSSIFQYTKTLN